MSRWNLAIVYFGIIAIFILNMTNYLLENTNPSTDTQAFSCNYFSFFLHWHKPVRVISALAKRVNKSFSWSLPSSGSKNANCWHSLSLASIQFNIACICKIDGGPLVRVLRILFNALFCTERKKASFWIREMIYVLFVRPQENLLRFYSNLTEKKTTLSYFESRDMSSVSFGCFAFRLVM